MPDTHAQTFARTKSLVIDGWRGISHSFALINQNQVLRLAEIDGLRLYHRDAPFAFSHWQGQQGDAGFTDKERAIIEGLPAPPDDAAVDAILRIASPYAHPTPRPGTRHATFMITELGLAKSNFVGGPPDPAAYTRDDDTIITSSTWSRDRIVEFGFAPDHVHLVPLGVDSGIFRPSTPDEAMATRARLGFAPDETVFLNVGAPLWNKGIDLLLGAFAQVRARGHTARLVLKDLRDVYGLSVEQVIRNMAPQCEALARQEVLASISVIPGSLPREQLRELYTAADAYVSPYRGEGFNLPVLEAIACGLPVIVTRGGATDDFVTDATGWRVDGRPGTRDTEPGAVPYRFIEPDPDALVEAMTLVAEGRRLDQTAQSKARALTLARFNWRHAADRVAALTVGMAPAPTTTTAPITTPAPTTHRAERVRLSIISHFYNNHDVVRAQIDNWKRIDPAIAGQIEFILVDDCSDTPIAIDKGALNLRLFRIDTDIDWNQPGARNLAALNARAPWAILHDIDQCLLPESLEALLGALGSLDLSTLYYLKGSEGMTPDEEGKPRDFHINSFLVCLEKFRTMGLYDEDFAGHYGWDDIFLTFVWENHGGRRALLTTQEFFRHDADAETKGLERDLGHNKALMHRKVANWHTQLACRSPRFLLRFAWREMTL